MEYWSHLSTKARTILAVLLAIVFVVSGWIGYPHFIKQTPSEEIIIPTEATQVTVYVTGAVNKPGVYTLPAGSRVQNAIQVAGGGRNDWDPEGVNLAKRLEDEAMIVVPARETNRNFTSPKQSSTREQDPQKKTTQIHGTSINKASLTDLELLPGIGPGMAKRIVAYRQTHGAFGSVEEIKKVPGLGTKKYHKIEPYLRL